MNLAQIMAMLSEQPAFNPATALPRIPAERGGKHRAGRLNKCAQTRQKRREQRRERKRRKN